MIALVASAASWLVGTKAGRAALVVAALAIAVALIWNTGRRWEAERRDAAEKTAQVEAYQRRARVDASVAKLSNDELCRQLGGARWDAEAKTCE